MSKYVASQAFSPVGSKLVRALTDAGIVPAECTRFELVLAPSDAVRAKCEFNVTPDQMQVIADAMKADHAEGKRIVLDAVLKKMPPEGSYALGGKGFVEVDGELREIDLGPALAQ